MGYDRCDSFAFDFKTNGIPFGSNRKKNSHHDHIPFNVKGNGNIVISVRGEYPPWKKGGVGVLGGCGVKLS